ncbi:hypothetical protein CRUP_022714, partial [Coryphaenoides rupestris]
MIGIAKTGSGKTAAFIWPMLVHIMDQKELEPGEGPIAIIVCPTRELCQQIHTECKRFGKAYSLRSGPRMLEALCFVLFDHKVKWRDSCEPCARQNRSH